MFSSVIASFSLIVLTQTLVAYASLYQYAKSCKQNTEICINLKCSSTQVRAARLPFSYHYLCCNGQIFDQKKYVCVRYFYLSKPVVKKCDPCTQFKCGDGQCTLKQWRCNKVKDCMDGSDEIGCGRCSSRQFRCRRANQCISASRVCDKYNDCRDGSDELNCPNEKGSRCGVSNYRCKNNQCIRWYAACNGRYDCADRSDESGYCGYYPSKYGKKRDEISNDEVLKKEEDAGKKGADVATGTVVN